MGDRDDPIKPRFGSRLMECPVDVVDRGIAPERADQVRDRARQSAGTPSVAKPPPRADEPVPPAGTSIDIAAMRAEFGVDHTLDDLDSALVG